MPWLTVACVTACVGGWDENSGPQKMRTSLAGAGNTLMSTFESTGEKSTSPNAHRRRTLLQVTLVQSFSKSVSVFLIHHQSHPVFFIIQLLFFFHFSFSILSFEHKALNQSKVECVCVC